MSKLDATNDNRSPPDEHAVAPNGLRAKLIGLLKQSDAGNLTQTSLSVACWALINDFDEAPLALSAEFLAVRERYRKASEEAIGYKDATSQLEANQRFAAATRSLAEAANDLEAAAPAIERAWLETWRLIVDALEKDSSHASAANVLEEIKRLKAARQQLLDEQRAHAETTRLFKFYKAETQRLKGMIEAPTFEQSIDAQQPPEPKKQYLVEALRVEIENRRGQWHPEDWEPAELEARLNALHDQGWALQLVVSDRFGIFRRIE